MFKIIFKEPHLTCNLHQWRVGHLSPLLQPLTPALASMLPRFLNFLFQESV